MLTIYFGRVKDAFGCFWVLSGAFGYFFVDASDTFGFWALSGALGYFWMLLDTFGDFCAPYTQNVVILGQHRLGYTDWGSYKIGPGSVYPNLC